MSNTYQYPSGGPGGYPNQQPGQQPRFQHPYQQRGPSPPQNMSRPPAQGAFHMNSPYGVMSQHPQQAIYTIPYQHGSGQVGVQYHVLSQTAQQYQQQRMAGGGAPGGGSGQVMSQAAPPFTPGAQYGGGHHMYGQHHGAPQNIIYSGGGPGGPHSLSMGMTPQGAHLGMYQGHRYPMGIPQPQPNINMSQVSMTQGPPGGSMVPPQGAPPPHSQQQQQQQQQQQPPQQQQQPPQQNMYSHQPPRGPVVSIATSGPPPSTTPQPSQSFSQAPPAPVPQPPPVSQPSNTLSRQRNRNPIKIIDPNTKQEVKVDNTISSKSTPAPSSDQSSTSSTPAPPEPVSTEREKSTGPKSREVATEFAAKVAALAEGSGSGSAKKEESSSPSSSPSPSVERKKESSPEEGKLEESGPAPAEPPPAAESIPVLAVPPVEEPAVSSEKVSVTSNLVVTTDIKRDENLYEPVSPTPLPDSPSDDTNKPVTETVKPSPFEEVINKKAGESDKKDEELPNSRKKKPSTAAKKAALNSKGEKKGDLLDVFTSIEDSQAKPEEIKKEVAELVDGIEDLSISKSAETIPASEAVENHENKDGEEVETSDASDAPKMNGVAGSTEVNSENELEDGEILDDENDSADSKSVHLKYDYPQGQWSPLNLEGKKQYGREFLITLQRDPLSMQKPDNLPKMEIVKDQPNPRQPQNRVDFAPPYVMKGSNSRTGGGVSKRNSQGGDKRGRGDRVDGRNKEVRVISLPSISQEVKLNKAENAWKPSVKEAKKEADDPKESEMEELRRKALAILNKLTPQKFETLVQRFQELPIDSYQKLAACMELVFEKAVDEPSFSVAYAMMCQELQKKKVPDEMKPEENVNFRKLLISRYFFKTNLIPINIYIYFTY